jgi:hypothetical protein
MGLYFHFPLLFSVLPDRYWSQAEDQQTKKNHHTLSIGGLPIALAI